MLIIAKKVNRKNEFRYHNSIQSKFHPVYIFAKVGKKFRFVGITHSNITDGMNNIPLTKNPNPNDKEPSYFRPFWDDAHYTSFSKKQKGARVNEGFINWAQSNF